MELTNTKQKIRNILTGFIFDYNDNETKEKVKLAFKDKGLYVKCDEENNPPEIVNARQLIVDISLPITRIRAIIESKGIEFSEL